MITYRNDEKYKLHLDVITCFRDYTFGKYKFSYQYLVELLMDVS